MWAVLTAAVLAGGCSSSGDGEPGTGTPGATRPIAADHVEIEAVGGIDEMRLTGVRSFPEETATLRGPSFSYSVVASVTTGTLTADQASFFGLPSGAAPAPGHELLLVELDPARAYLPPDAMRVSPQRVEVVAGSVTRRLPPESTLTGTLVMSVPTGSRPVLRVTDKGRTQSLDLSTGRRGADAVAGYYPVRRFEWQPSELKTSSLQLSGPGTAGLSAGERLAGMQLDDVEGTLLPYVEGRGWARKGRAWLSLKAEIDYTRLSAGTSKSDRITVDLRSFTVTGSDGTRYPVSGRPLVIGQPTSPTDFPVGQGGAGRLLLDVPATLSRATVSYTFSGTIRLPKGPVSYSIYADPTQTGPLVRR